MITKKKEEEEEDKEEKEKEKEEEEEESKWSRGAREGTPMHAAGGEGEKCNDGKFLCSMHSVKATSFKIKNEISIFHHMSRRRRPTPTQRTAKSSPI